MHRERKKSLVVAGGMLFCGVCLAGVFSILDDRPEPGEITEENVMLAAQMIFSASLQLATWAIAIIGANCFVSFTGLLCDSIYDTIMSVIVFGLSFSSLALSLYFMDSAVAYAISGNTSNGIQLLITIVGIQMVAVFLATCLVVIRSVRVVFDIN